MVPQRRDWVRALDARIKQLDKIPGMPAGMPRANADAIDATLNSPSSAPAGNEPGAVCVVNMASEHLSDFCSSNSNQYMNVYDLVRRGKLVELGVKPPANPPTQRTVSPTRERVDGALSFLTGCDPDKIYFLAIELNGTGIRFYGDVCLVLKAHNQGKKNWILESNSYDLVRDPKKKLTNTGPGLRSEVENISGYLDEDLSRIAAVKIFAKRQDHRRLTVGQISDAVLDDEDYIEVLQIGSFTCSDVKEARLSAAGVAQDARIDERMRHGPVPDAASIKWRKQRRRAETALVAMGIPVRVVTTTGRTKV